MIEFARLVKATGCLRLGIVRPRPDALEELAAGRLVGRPVWSRKHGALQVFVNLE